MIFLPATEDDYCPVKALNHWLEIAMIEKGPLFYKINKSNTIEKYTMNYKNQKVSLNDSSFVLILKKEHQLQEWKIAIKYQAIAFV